MIHLGKRNVLGILVDVIDYNAALELIIAAARRRRPFAVSALAVHGVMTGVLDSFQRFRLNSLDLLVPDGQPVRWALNLLFRSRLQDRVYGPNLTLRLCERAAHEAIPIYIYGSKPETLVALQKHLKAKFPNLCIVGAEPSRFRQLTFNEKQELIGRIRLSGARIIFVGLGCPRQEVWAYEYREDLSAPIIAVGAAFDFIAGNLQQAPDWMQRNGLEWLFRLCIEPGRLWRRYIYLNPLYSLLLVLQALGLYRPNPVGQRPAREVLYG